MIITILLLKKCASATTSQASKFKFIHLSDFLRHFAISSHSFLFILFLCNSVTSFCLSFITHFINPLIYGSSCSFCLSVTLFCHHIYDVMMFYLWCFIILLLFIISLFYYYLLWCFIYDVMISFIMSSYLTYFVILIIYGSSCLFLFIRHPVVLFILNNIFCHNANLWLHLPILFIGHSVILFIFKNMFCHCTNPWFFLPIPFIRYAVISFCHHPKTRFRI